MNLKVIGFDAYKNDRIKLNIFKKAFIYLVRIIGLFAILWSLILICLGLIPTAIGSFLSYFRKSFQNKEDHDFLYEVFRIFEIEIGDRNLDFFNEIF